ncbi:hypothetical protein CJU60_15815 [Bacillus sp. 7705b]|nr:hypothetical protein CJU60_15815 [Bacillus sp. 7705b]
MFTAFHTAVSWIFLSVLITSKHHRSPGQVLLGFQTGTLRRVHLVKLRRFSANPVLCGKLFQGYLSSSALFIFSLLNSFSAVQEDRLFFIFLESYCNHLCL